MVDFQYKDSYDVNDLVEIVRILRSPGGCPWDAEQTHESIRRDFLEEAYEAVEAIDEGSTEHLKEELGDVLLQVALHARMEEEQGSFDLNGVADGVCKKLIYRHPHVFGDVAVSGTGEVLTNWRPSSGRRSTRPPTPTPSTPLPAPCPPCGGPRRSRKRRKRPASTGRMCPARWTSCPRSSASSRPPWLRTATWRRSWETCSSSAVNAARFVKVDPEAALQKATEKFIARFRRVEELAGDRPMEDMDLAELDKLWEQAKHQA